MVSCGCQVVMVTQLVEHRHSALQVPGSNPGQTSLQARKSCREVTPWQRRLTTGGAGFTMQ